MKLTDLEKSFGKEKVLTIDVINLNLGYKIVRIRY